ncbi:hypothetical protein Lalb_Chr02g0153191 [Lupinus albus]|uniref:Uncharacterized protein n=1 Tax=Lupinus albus TaxID=3870 RepID=A0A6A4QX57_LUPAL|nr:hypothetical protein Lalb_Chr02g0153191 [Lupinus albus]
MRMGFLSLAVANGLRWWWGSRLSSSSSLFSSSPAMTLMEDERNRSFLFGSSQ